MARSKPPAPRRRSAARPLDLQPPKRTGARAKFRIADMVEAIRKGGGIYTFAARLIEQRTGKSCAANTVKHYVQRYPECRTAYDEITETTKDIVEHQIIKNAKGGEPWAVIWYSRNKMRDRGYGNSIEISGQLNHAHSHDHHLRIESMRDNLLLEIESHAQHAAAGPQTDQPRLAVIDGRKRSNGSASDH